MPILVLILVAAVVEISVLVLVGQAIGLLPTLGLLIAGGVLGTWLMRREGRRTLREFSEAARLRRPPEREISDGLIIALGGLLIILPGFVSDVLGLLCLLPPTRALLRRALGRWAERRAEQLNQQGRMRSTVYGGSGVGRSTSSTRGDVIDGEVVSVDEDDGPPADPPRRISSDPSAQADPPRNQPGR